MFRAHIDSISVVLRVRDAEIENVSQSIQSSKKKSVQKLYWLHLQGIRREWSSILPRFY